MGTTDVARSLWLISVSVLIVGFKAWAAMHLGYVSHQISYHIFLISVIYGKLGSELEFKVVITHTSVPLTRSVLCSGPILGVIDRPVILLLLSHCSRSKGETSMTTTSHGGKRYATDCTLCHTALWSEIYDRTCISTRTFCRPSLD